MIAKNFYNSLCTIGVIVINFKCKCHCSDSQVRYRILYNGTMGISSVWAQFTLHNVASSVTLVPQIFSTQFEHVSNR